jgi:serine/threonine-protein kinase RsbW
MQNRLSITEHLPSDLKLINSFINTIHQKVIDVTGSSQDAFDVKLCLEEALTNAMRHGNKLDASKRVAVAIILSQESIQMDILDQGEGFDVDLIPDPTVEPGRAAPSGRGIYLMRSLMNEVAFYNKGAGIRLKKQFKLS